MRRVLIWVSRAIVIAVALALFVAVAVNAYDPPLAAGLQKKLDEPAQPSETARRAFYYVLGATAGEKGDPEAKGAALWETRNSPDFEAKLRGPSPWTTREFDRCRPDDACTVASLARDPNLVGALEKNADVVRHYTKLMEYGEGSTLTTEEGDAPVSGLPPGGHQLFLLQLAQWQRHGGGARVQDLLASSNAYMQSYLRTGSLYDRLVAAVNLAANRRFATALAASGVHVSDEVMRGFVATPSSAQILEGAARTELRFAYGRLRSGQKLENESWKDHLVRRLLTRPNETTALYDEALTQLMASDCPVEMDVRTCLPILNFPPAAFFVNPVGKEIVRQTITQLHGYRPKLQSLLRAVRE